MSKRLFFTKFGWDNIDSKAIERSIKLFSLINNELVIPSKHIYSLHAEKFLYKHPELVELNLIKPAMDPQYDSFQDYFSQRDRERKAGRPLKDYGVYLDSLSIEKILYSDTEPAGIFTDLAIEQFSNENSVLQQAIEVGPISTRRFLDELEQIKEVNNGVVYFEHFSNAAEKYFDYESMIVIRKFAELNRLIAGAGSKNCNNLIPQENLIDWCLANPDSPQNFILDDEKIFWEVFFESMVKLTEGLFSIRDLEKISPKVLDRLSFNDIHDFKLNGVLQNRFINKYDSIISRINGVPKLGDGKLELLNFDELISLKESMKNEFSSTLSKEARLYKELEVIESLLKVAYQIFGGAVQSVDAVINFFSIPMDKRKNWNKFLSNQEKRIQKASRFASKRISGDPVLIEYMEMLLKKSKDAWHK